ncbi:ATP-binding cassette domain-containing protein, partial [Xanthomonas vesicatoria]|uniref:ATP-binding cassette domain-containing protein n=1 Tax=Xanthomonas vesicatoria TaxID=56460 RepID=UPI000F8DC287
LDGFERAIANAETMTTKQDIIHVASGGHGAIDLTDVTVTLPNGKPMVDAPAFNLRSGERTLVTGPSGSGKSTLFRAIAGIWPFGKGNISIPTNASLMMLPQRPYFPVGPLQDAIAYPAGADGFTAQQIADAVAAVGLPALAARLD